MKSTFCILVVSLITTSFLSCKKDNTSAQPESNSSTTPPPTSATLYDGMVSIVHTSPVGSAPNAYYNFDASFFDKSVDLVNPPSFSHIDVGAVTVNTRVLKKTNGPAGPGYVDTTNQISGPSFSISAGGNGSVNPFNLHFNQGYPALGNTGQIPSVINRSAGLTFTLTNVSNTDSIRISIVTPNSSGLAKYVTVQNGNATFSFSPAQLQNDLSSTSSGGSIRLTLMKTNTIVSSASKNYSFNTEEYYTKTGITVQ